jgi:hypothetical protein
MVRVPNFIQDLVTNPRAPQFVNDMAQSVRNQLRQPGTVFQTVTNPTVGLTALAGTAGLGAGVAEYRRRTAPERVAELNGGFDSLGQPTEALQRGMNKWDEQQWSRYQDAASTSLQNQVRLGQISPAEAEARLQQVNYSVNTDNVNNSGQLQQGAMAATDFGSGLNNSLGPDQSMFPNYANTYGDTSQLGIGNEYWQQIANAAKNQTLIGEDVGDIAVGREARRTMQYRRPIERDRNLETYYMGESQARNDMRRNMALGLMQNYANTQQALITSGL